MHVLLVHPPLARRTFNQAGLVQEPLTHLAVGAALRPTHEVRLVDLRRDKHLGVVPTGFDPGVVALGTGPLSRPTLDSTLREIRARFPAASILLYAEAEYGLEHVVEHPEAYQHPLADAQASVHFLGPLRELVSEFVDAIENETPLESVPGLRVQVEPGTWAQTPERTDEVANFGVPDRSLLGRHRGSYHWSARRNTGFLVTAYGCHHRCRYCPMGRWSGAIWERDLEDVIGELRAMTEPNVFLMDYEPLLAPEWMTRLAERIEAEGIRKRFNFMTRADSVIRHPDLLARWKRLGLDQLYLGFDADTPSRLREVHKGNAIEDQAKALSVLRRLGIPELVGFLVRSDFTPEDFRELRRYVRELEPRQVVFSVETPLTGTELGDAQRDRLTTDDTSLFDLGHAVLPTRMPLRRFYRELARMHLFGMGRSGRATLGYLSPMDSLRASRDVAMPLLRMLWAGHRDHESKPPLSPQAG